MRPPVDAERVRAFVVELASAARQLTTIYLTGGATAVIEGWRASTVDIDLRVEPESDDLLKRMAAAKDELGINVELVSPPDFVPELREWRERSPFVFQQGNIIVRRYPAIDPAALRDKVDRTLGA